MGIFIFIEGSTIILYVSKSIQSIKRPLLPFRIGKRYFFWTEKKTRIIIIIIIKRKICFLLFVPIQNTHMYTFVTSFHGPSHSIPNTMYINIYKSFASVRRNVPIYIYIIYAG